ncbi:MAG: 4-hydroxybenzoate octaprenyltransferase [Hyphomicrobiales bacterium]
MKQTRTYWGQVADAAHSFVERNSPTILWPYARLARLDRPIGTWLLLLPCWWSVALATGTTGGGLVSLWLLVLFAVGAIVMRGAGCTFNDIVDRDFDAKVARTRSRPIPSGQVSVRNAWAFLIFQCLVGLAVLLQFNRFAVLVGVVSLLIVAIYPFMKRITYWPQVVLGLAFNWGALLGWAAVCGDLLLPAFVLYAAGLSWTLAYDTIYAHQDKEDDILIGVKSTALKFGADTPRWLVIFFAFTLLLLGVTGWLVGAGIFYYGGLGLAALHASWQLRVLDIDNPDICLKLFRSNRDFGLIVFAAMALDTLFKAA